MLDGVDLDTSVNSTATVTTTIDHMSINLTWASAASSGHTGQVVIQGTNSNPDDPSFAAADWFDLTLSGGDINLTGATSGEHIVVFDKIPFRAIRLSYTNSTHSAGTFSAIMSAKTIGA